MPRFKLRFLSVTLALTIGITVVAEYTILAVGQFSENNIEGWQEKHFSGETNYQLVPRENSFVLKADSRESASGYVRKMEVDLEKTPYLNWQWRIENRLSTTDEKTKMHDDFAVRVYVVVSGGLFFWNTKAINYVWTNQLDTGEYWPNPFATNNVMMLALRSRDDQTATWYTEKRNVYDDFKKLFGKEIRYIDSIAVMTDTDNHGDQVTSYYGDIYFTSE